MPSWWRRQCPAILARFERRLLCEEGKACLPLTVDETLRDSRSLAISISIQMREPVVNSEVQHQKSWAALIKSQAY